MNRKFAVVVRMLVLVVALFGARAVGAQGVSENRPDSAAAAAMTGTQK